MLMHWERILALMAVADTGGFSAAARRLGKTQSAVSQAVSQLERDLRQSLVVRQRGRVRPTQAGELLLLHARRAEEEMAHAQRQLVELSDLQVGRLTIATTDTLACYFMPPALSAFRRRYPQVDVVLRTAPSPASTRSVLSGEAEVAVVTLPLADPALQPPAVRVLPLQEQPELVIVGPEHPLSTKRRIRWPRLAQEPLLLLEADTAGRQFLAAQFRQRGLSLTPRMEMNSVELLKRLVELGFGAAIVPALSVQRELAQGSLCGLQLWPRAAARTGALVLPALGRESQAARAFAEVALAELRPLDRSVDAG